MTVFIQAAQIRGLLTSVLVSCTLLLAACTGEENPTITGGQGVNQYVSANNLTLLNAALTRAGATTLLSGAGPFYAVCADGRCLPGGWLPRCSRH